MSFKDISFLLKNAPKRMWLILIIIIIIIVSTVKELGVKDFIAAVGIGIVGYIIAKLSYGNY